MRLLKFLLLGLFLIGVIAFLHDFERPVEPPAESPVYFADPSPKLPMSIPDALPVIDKASGYIKSWDGRSDEYIERMNIKRRATGQATGDLPR